MKTYRNVSLKTKAYYALKPHIERLTRQAYQALRVLPKAEVAIYFLCIYLAIGFILEGAVNVVPAYLLRMFGLPEQVISMAGMVLFVGWPGVVWFLGGEEHALLSLGLVLIGATYASHLKHVGQVRAAALDAPQAAARQAASPVRAAQLETVSDVETLSPVEERELAKLRETAGR